MGWVDVCWNGKQGVGYRYMQVLTAGVQKLDLVWSSILFAVRSPQMLLKATPSLWYVHGLSMCLRCLDGRLGTAGGKE